MFGWWLWFGCGVIAEGFGLVLMVVLCIAKFLLVIIAILLLLQVLLGPIGVSAGDCISQTFIAPYFACNCVVRCWLFGPIFNTVHHLCLPLIMVCCRLARLFK